jgi:hypothetical protein
MSIRGGSPSAPIGTLLEPEFAQRNQALDTLSGWGPGSMLKHNQDFRISERMPQLPDQRDPKDDLEGGHTAPTHLRVKPSAPLRGPTAKSAPGGQRQPRKQSIHRAHGIIFGPGKGGTPQMADAQGDRGGVGIRVSLPWVDALPPVMHWPVKVLMSG